jgi:hypothetical protein
MTDDLGIELNTVKFIPLDAQEQANEGMYPSAIVPPGLWGGG